MKYFLFILIFIISACNTEKKVLIHPDTFLPNGLKNTQYIYKYLNKSDEFITTIMNNNQQSIVVRDTLKLSKNKIVNSSNYRISLMGGNLIAETISNEFILIANTETWHSKVFSYHPIPKERAFVQECTVLKEYKEEVLHNVIDVIEITCKYTNEVKTKITHTYKYATNIGMVEKIELANGVVTSHLKLTEIVNNNPNLKY